MAPARYFLIQQGDDWVIRFGDETFGPYRTLDEAKLFAVDAARHLGEHGEAAEVCLMGEGGSFRAEWSSGEAVSP
jgi:hypothetical protein